MDSVTHLAAPSVGVSGRVVQRCAVCGAKLRDSRGSAAPLNPDGTPPDFPVWEVGALVRVRPGSEVRAGHWDDAAELPADFCLALVE